MVLHEPSTTVIDFLRYIGCPHTDTLRANERSPQGGRSPWIIWTEDYKQLEVRYLYGWTYVISRIEDEQKIRDIAKFFETREKSRVNRRYMKEFNSYVYEVFMSLEFKWWVRTPLKPSKAKSARPIKQ